jgi:hypothetical protein
VWFNTVRLIITHYTRAPSPTTDGCETMQQESTTGALASFRVQSSTFGNKYVLAPARVLAAFLLCDIRKQ